MFNGRMDGNETKKIMGLIIAFLREEAGMSRYALAKNAGVDTSWLRRFELGKSGIRVETLIALARGLQIPAGTIVTMMAEALGTPDKALVEYSQKLEEQKDKNKKVKQGSMLQPSKSNIDRPGKKAK